MLVDVNIALVSESAFCEHSDKHGTTVQLISAAVGVIAALPLSIGNTNQVVD